MGVVPGITLIANSTSLSGGKPGNSQETHLGSLSLWVYYIGLASLA